MPNVMLCMGSLGNDQHAETDEHILYFLYLFLLVRTLKIYFMADF